MLQLPFAQMATAQKQPGKISNDLGDGNHLILLVQWVVYFMFSVLKQHMPQFTPSASCATIATYNDTLQNTSTLNTRDLARYNLPTALTNGLTSCQDLGTAFMSRS